MEKQKNVYSVVEVIQHLKLFTSYLRKKWIWLLLATIAGAVLGFFYYQAQKPKYKAVCTFILE
jgi:uncharacterized protein involved in exopolysaccharide biosynthesis